MNDGFLVIRAGFSVLKREIAADSKGKGSCNQAGLPTPVPRAYHDCDGEYDQPAFDYVGEHQRWDQSEDNAQNGHAVAQDWRTGGRDGTSAKQGEHHSHVDILFANPGTCE